MSDAPQPLPTESERMAEPVPGPGPGPELGPPRSRDPLSRFLDWQYLVRERVLRAWERMTL